jgi:hypothetical protein
MHVPGKEVHQFVPDALSRLCENNMPPKTTVASSSHGILAAMVPTFHIPDAIFRVIAKVHNSAVGHHGLQMCKKRLKAQGYNFTDRMITQFIRQCPCCQVMNRLRIPIRTHPFTCASYNPFEVLLLDHIGPLKADDKGYTYILVIIDAFSRWVELFPTTSVCAYETASCLFQHFGRFGTPASIHTDRGTAFHNELIAELTRLVGTDHSLSTAYSKEENGIVERANQEVLRHLTAILFDKRVSHAWSYEQLPMVQRIMNTVEKTSTGVSPAELILNNSIRLTSAILSPPSISNSKSQISLSDVMDRWISKQTLLLKVAQKNQRVTDSHHLVVHDPRVTEFPLHSYVLFSPPVGRSDKLVPRHRGPYQVMHISGAIYTIQDLVNGKVLETHIHNLRPFNYDEERTDPVAVAQQNAQEFVVEEVLAHRGDRAKRSTLEFRIRWSGFGEESDSWEPYKNLMHAEPLHRYLRAHQMRTLIPKEHK